MPNWCYNSVNFTGDSKDIRKMKSIIENQDDGKANMFEKLIGRDESITDEKFNDGGWYNHNIARYGTKWDVDSKGFEFTDDDEGSWSDDTAWSPPMEFWRQCSELYSLSVEMYYEEPGGDFCGKCKLSNGQIMEEEDYSYQGGVYAFEGYAEWYDREWEGYGRENFVENFDVEKIPSRKEVLEEIENWYEFLNDSEKEELVDEVMKELIENFNKVKLKMDEPGKIQSDGTPSLDTVEEVDDLPF